MDFTAGLKWAARIAIIAVGVAAVVILITFITQFTITGLPTSIITVVGVAVAIMNHYGGTGLVLLVGVIILRLTFEFVMITAKWVLIAWRWAAKALQ